VQVVETVQIADVEASHCSHLERLLADVISAEAISERHGLAGPIEPLIGLAGY
jgi:hypothetical protein